MADLGRASVAPERPERVVFKLNWPHRTERTERAARLQKLARAGGVAVAEIVLDESDADSAVLHGVTCVAHRWLPGRALEIGEAELAPGAFALLARLHRTGPSSLPDEAWPEPSRTPRKWVKSELLRVRRFRERVAVLLTQA